MERKPTLSDLLALRDGELDDAELAAEIYADPESRDTLVRLSRIKGDLNALPPVAPPPALWEGVQRSRRGRPQWLQRFPLATAATVFLAAALTIVVWNPAGPLDEDVTGPRVNDPVGQLMLRSQRLESELVTRATAPAAFSSSEQAMLYGIAEVDAQLNALYEAGAPDPEERERLWRQRVTLLESLTEIQKGQAMLRPAIY